MKPSCLLVVLVVYSGAVDGAMAQYGPSVVTPSSPVSGYSRSQYPSTGYSTPLPAPRESVPHQPTPLPATHYRMPVVATQRPAPAPLDLPMSVVPAASSLSPAGPGAVYPSQPYSANDPYLSDAGCFSCNNGGCGTACGSTWFVSLSALYMGRDDPNSVWTTYETGDYDNPLMNSQDARADWQPGGELRFGRRIGHSNWRWEVSYWTLATMNGYASQTHASGVSSLIGISDLRFSGASGTAYFNGAFEQRLWRSNDFHNVELNFFNACLCGNVDSGFSIGGLAGLRYFRFEENLTFGSLCGGGVWHGNGGADEAYLEDNIENDLFGFQFGFDTRWRSCGRRLGLYATPKFGIYNNHITNRFRAYRGDGVVAVPSAGSGAVGSFPVNSSKDEVAFLTQLDLGVDYAITPCWSLGMGYRILAITGMGLADSQYPSNAVDFRQIADIDSNGHLILHGAMFTLTYSR